MSVFAFHHHESAQIRQIDVIAVDEFLWISLLGIPCGRSLTVNLSEYRLRTLLQERIEGMHRLVEAFVRIEGIIFCSYK